MLRIVAIVCMRFRITVVRRTVAIILRIVDIRTRGPGMSTMIPGEPIAKSLHLFLVLNMFIFVGCHRYPPRA